MLSDSILMTCYHADLGPALAPLVLNIGECYPPDKSLSGTLVLGKIILLYYPLDRDLLVSGGWRIGVLKIYFTQSEALLRSG